jgi:hypothetical protein
MHLNTARNCNLFKAPGWKPRDKLQRRLWGWWNFQWRKVEKKQRKNRKKERRKLHRPTSYIQKNKAINHWCVFLQNAFSTFFPSNFYGTSLNSEQYSAVAISGITYCREGWGQIQSWWRPNCWHLKNSNQTSSERLYCSAARPSSKSCMVCDSCRNGTWHYGSPVKAKHRAVKTRVKRRSFTYSQF